MKRIFTAALIFASVAATASAMAAGDRAYSNGPVWDVAAIQTKDGHFEDYMKFLDTGWKAQQEALKKIGVVLDYKVLTVADPRDNEPDLYLMVEYKNMAAMDATPDEIDAMTSKVFGSVASANQGQIDRAAIRTQRGDMLTRELILK